VTKKQKLEKTKAPTTTASRKPTPVKKSGTSSSAKPQVSRQPSVEEVLDERDAPRSFPPRNPKHILELDDDEEDDDPPPPAMDVDDDDDEPEDVDDDEPEAEEEDDEAELGLFSSLVCKKKNLKCY
jgi:hypothetical protein